MELRHVRYFIAVAEELHFGRAARRLHIAQPPLSQQIRQLEEEIGTPLFTRTSHKVDLTPAGAQFLPEARKILQQAESAVENAAKAGRGQLGTIVIGTVDVALHAVLPTVIKPFTRTNPEISIQLQVMNSSEQKCALMNKTIDFAFGYADLNEKGLTCIKAWTGTLMLAVAEDHPLAGARSVDLRRLGKEPFVFPERHLSPPIYDMLLTYCHESGLTPNITQHANRIYSALGLVALGMGLALVPSAMDLLNWPGVVLVPMKGKKQKLTIFLCARHTEGCPMHDNFLAAARAALPVP